MNYGEELAYWYLRLNGFFPITNFVLHRNAEVQYTSDIDVLAVRPPHVFEAVGGNPGDWDAYLSDRLDLQRTIGLICEVKTGAYEENQLFRQVHMRYALGRLGLVRSDCIALAADDLASVPVLNMGNHICITKLFVSPTEHTSDFYLNRTIEQIENFLEDRVRRYPVEKYGARLFFSSPMFQALIDRIHRSIQQRNAV